MINNKSFNEWLEKEKLIVFEDGEYQDKLKGYDIIPQDWLIGLMTQWLLDKGCEIFHNGDDYCVICDDWFETNASLYDCLVEAINKIGEV
jgi:hypothetical protein